MKTLITEFFCTQHDVNNLITFIVKIIVENHNQHNYEINSSIIQFSFNVKDTSHCHKSILLLFSKIFFQVKGTYFSYKHW